MTVFTWDTLTAQLQNYLQQDPAQPGTQPFTAALPTIVSNAEQRIYRELDFLSTRGQVAQTTCMAGQRSVTFGGLNTNDVPVYPIVVQGVAIVTPVNTVPAEGTRVQYQLASLDYIDMIWPTEAVTAAPTEAFAYYAMYDHQTAVLAPTPDQNYTVEVTGTFRPAPLSPNNEETWLSDNLPDLLFAACMVEATGFLRDYGAQADDPKFALSWETRYTSLRESAREEEQRKKGQGPGWQPFQQSLATPPRT